MEFRNAIPEDYEAVREFYYALTDAMTNAEYKPGWKKDIYPSQDMLKEAIEKKELYVLLQGSLIVAAMILNQEYNEAYDAIEWSLQVENSEVYVIHALGVNKDYSGKGIAKMMVQYAIGIAKNHQAKTMRLDVLEGNIPAEKAYVSVGFRYVTTMRMYYADTGWTNFRAFEYII